MKIPLNTKSTSLKGVDFSKKPNWNVILYLAFGGVFIIVAMYVYKYVRVIGNDVNSSIQASNAKAVQNKVETFAEYAKPEQVLSAKEAFRKRWVKIGKQKLDALLADADRLAFALGTNPQDVHKFSVLGIKSILFNVKAWTEDEKSAVSILKKYPGTFQALSEAYYNFSTKGNNLRADLLKYLSSKDLTEVRKAHKAFGFTNI